MPLFNGQILWRGIGTPVVVGLLVLLALAFAVVGYVERSSDDVTAFVSATKSSVSDSNDSDEPPAQLHSANGGTGCPLGKRLPPTQLMPLP